jgi:hypothetical protein
MLHCSPTFRCGVAAITLQDGLLAGRRDSAAKGTSIIRLELQLFSFFDGKFHSER